jgi:hypothetical protein
MGVLIKMLEEIEKAILEEAVYEEESLDGIIYGSLKHGVCQDPKDVIDPILNLLAAKKLKIYYSSGWGGDPYLDITSLPPSDLKEYLLAYIERHKKEFNNVYPKDGGQFFIQATD